MAVGADLKRFKAAGRVRNLANRLCHQEVSVAAFDDKMVIDVTKDLLLLASDLQRIPIAPPIMAVGTCSSDGPGKHRWVH